MVIVVFRSRLREGVDESELTAIGIRMYELASSMPGFISYNEYVAGSGENVSIVEFASHETLLAWRNQPEHVEVQRLGRERFFAEYRISVCDVVRDYAFPTV
jgi:heme-degrading monooxygenase HmoA